MLEIERSVSEAMKVSVPFRARAVEDAVLKYFDHLGGTSQPSIGLLEAAITSARSAAEKQLLSPECLSVLAAGRDIDAVHQAALAQCFGSIAPELRVPAPGGRMEIPATRTAISGLVGALAGMFVLAPLTRILLDMRDVGLFLGPPIGAFLLILGFHKASHSNWLRRFLIAAFGVATMAEVLALTSGAGMFGRVWRRLGGRTHALMRILIYMAVLALLILLRPTPRYDRREHEETVRSLMRLWVDHGTTLICFLSSQPSDTEGGRGAEVNALYKLGARIQALHGASPKILPVAADELIQEARNLGFGRLDGAPAFLRDGPVVRKMLVWSDELKEEYDTFGSIEPGDQVIVESEPVVFEGRVRDKGLVRKVRSGRTSDGS